MSVVEIALQRLSNGADLPLPAYESVAAAGMDLVAAVETAVSIGAGERALIPTGFAMALPEGYEAQVRPRSGLALNAGVTVLNTPGTVDADYRGEVGVILINHGSSAFIVQRGDRIAQMVIAPVTRGQWRETETLDQTARGAGGFGSTGTGA